MLLEPVITALAVFTLVFLALRWAEWLYHRLRRTRDWSPHWGSWVFALLVGVYALVQALGR
jgi:poly(3-hydroxyalkanoate) synthetase